MSVLRPVETRDEMPLARLSQVMEEGLTSLPRHPIDLRQRIMHSIESFAAKEIDGSEIYLFVLEDLETKELLGTSQIMAKTLGSTQGYYYRKESYKQPANRLQAATTVPFLRPIRHIVESSELGGLFLHPSARKKGLSKLLSLGRLLYIVSFPERFQPEVIAEMRGYMESNGHSAFWDAIGRHFLNIQFDELMRQVALDPGFIQNILPPFPICLSMLPLHIQELAGKTHIQSQTALQRLFAEGFQYTGEIDVFDGGPKISAEVRSLKIVKTYRTARAVCCTLPSGKQEAVLLANHRPQFRICMATVCVQSPETVLIAPESAKRIQISTGELVHYLPIHHPATTEQL